MFGLYYDIWCVDPEFGDGGGFWVVYYCFHVDGVAFFVLEFPAGRAARCRARAGFRGHQRWWYLLLGSTPFWLHFPDAVLEDDAVSDDEFMFGMVPDLTSRSS